MLYSGKFPKFLIPITLINIYSVDANEFGASVKLAVIDIPASNSVVTLSHQAPLAVPRGGNDVPCASPPPQAQ